MPTLPLGCPFIASKTFTICTAGSITQHQLVFWAMYRGLGRENVSKVNCSVILYTCNKLYFGCVLHYINLDKILKTFYFILLRWMFGSACVYLD